MRKVIICEKPSLAASVTKAIALSGERVERKNGYMMSDSYYIVPVFGHLFTLYDMEEYDSIHKKWDTTYLPFIPEKFKFSLKKNPKTKEIDEGIKKQFELIKTLLKQKDVYAVVNCGDSDREGEIIVRIVLTHACNTLPVYRLWLPDQTEETILHGLKTMKPDSEYDALAAEGYARMFIDWIYGINLTRYATVKSNSLLRVGRVISVIIKAIYDRDMEIESFKPTKYYAIQSKVETLGETIELTSKTKFQINEYETAKAFCDSFNSAGATVTEVKKEQKVIASPKLFSQSTLQNELSEKYKYSPFQTLQLVQALYERGYVSYPRTSTEYMATAEKEKVARIIQTINQTLDTDIITFKDSKRIFDDSKIESHSAITPTNKIPKESDFKSEEEKNCYITIFNRFLSVFYKDDCIVDETRLSITTENVTRETFCLKGNVSRQLGWRAIEPQKSAEKVLPDLKVGDKINIDFKPIEKETQPPKHYTIKTLNSFLLNPFKSDASDISEEESEREAYKAILDGLEIGTEATRAGIIENAVRQEYIQLKGSTYTITENGKHYIQCLNALEINMSKEKTAMLGKTLKDVYKGTTTIDNAIEIVKEELEETIRKDRAVAQSNNCNFPSLSAASVGNCPKCGHSVTKNKKCFKCTNQSCDFFISKVICEKELTERQVNHLLSRRYTDVIRGFKKKSGDGTFSAKLLLNLDNEVKFQFTSKK